MRTPWSWAKWPDEAKSWVLQNLLQLFPCHFSTLEQRGAFWWCWFHTASRIARHQERTWRIDCDLTVKMERVFQSKHESRIYFLLSWLQRFLHLWYCFLHALRTCLLMEQPFASSLPITVMNLTLIGHPKRGHGCLHRKTSNYCFESELESDTWQRSVLIWLAHRLQKSFLFQYISGVRSPWRPISSNHDRFCLPRDAQRTRHPQTCSQLSRVRVMQTCTTVDEASPHGAVMEGWSKERFNQEDLKCSWVITEWLT